MKILFVLHSTLINAGSTKSLLALISQLENQGHTVGLVAPDEKGIFEVLKNKGNFTLTAPYLTLNFNKDINKFSPYYLRSRIYRNRVNSLAIKNLLDKVKEFNPDIIHENTSVTDIGFKLAKQLKKPYVLHFREYGDKDFNWFIPGINKRTKDKNSFTISITKGIQKHRHQVKNPQAIQIYNGIIKDDSIRYTENKKPYFLFGGRIEKAKGVYEMLTAYDEYIKNSEANNITPLPLKIAGKFNDEDPYFIKCKDFTIQSCILDHIEWLGESNNLKDLMYYCTATIIPSIFEGFGRVLPEALANGSLCVVRNTGGSEEQLEIGLKTTGGPIGLSFNTENELSQLLYEITVEVSNSTPFIKDHIYYRIIHNGQQYIKEFLTIEQNGRATIEFYKKILQNKKYDYPQKYPN